MPIEDYQINNKHFVINHEIQLALIDDTAVPLTKAEFDVMCYFLHNPAKLISKREFEKDVLGLVFDRNNNVLTGASSVYSHISRIKKKLNKINEGLGGFIVNRPSLGWYLNTDKNIINQDS